MLDTVVINLNYGDFKINKPDRFTPHAGFASNPMYGDKGIIKCYYNPSKKEKVQGYLPRVTLFKKPFGEYSKSIWLKIEFSAPKLIFGNNFEELQDDDFDSVIIALLDGLKRMGIDTSAEHLINARISAIHYSKNILLERETPCHVLIQMLEKADMNNKLDLNKADFRNGGQMVKYHASTFEIALYDKVKDLEQASKYGNKRGAETDYECQINMFNNPIKPEVLRFEIRLQARKIKSLLKTLNSKQPITFKGLFNGNFSRAVLMHYWQEITNGLYVMNVDSHSTERLIANIHKAFLNKRPQSISSLIGFIMTCQQNGTLGAKLLLGLNNSQYYRMKADVKKLDQDDKNPRFRAMGIIKSQLRDFIPLIKDDIVKTELLKTL
jgi:hypothetical protein